jgi:ABC-type phosphate transport system permease subunit
MGIMIIPFVSSLSDDIITQVPRALRDGSLGLGATNLKPFVKWYYQQHFRVLRRILACSITCHR